MRRLISSGSSFEAEIGYSRAVVDGDWIFVSGTTGFDYRAMTIVDDVAGQCAQALANIEAALNQAGAAMRDIVRVRYTLPNGDDFPACWPVLRAAFGEIRPAATMLVTGLADPRMKIEIEVTARRNPPPADWPAVTLVLGGVRSGKSRHAETLVRGAAPGPWTYIATAEALDDEMRERIAHHRAARAKDGWMTVEVPLALAQALNAQPPARPVLVDCLTLWLTNMMLGEHDPAAAQLDLADALARRSGPTVLVANEVGQGIVPDNALARAFRDQAGRLNQRIAERAGRVVLVVAGIPMAVKGAAGPIA